MANNVLKVNGIAIANIAKLNGITDANLVKLNGEEFTGYNPTEAHTLIATRDIAVLGASSSITITSGIDDTYDVYEFHFTNMHPANNGVEFGFQVNASDDEGGGFDTSPITSNVARMYTDYDNSSKSLAYRTGTDQAQGAAYQKMTEYTSNENDSGVAGVLTLYAPSSTTYMKHFMLTTTDMYHDTSLSTFYIGGYINTGDPADQPAITEISFKFSAGNINAGVIKMYGVAKS